MRSLPLHRLIPLLGAFAIFSTPEAWAQQNMDNVQIVAHQIRGGIYYLEGQGGNIGLSIGEDGVVMIDDQFAPLTERIVTAIRQLSSGEIRFLINTHVHGDHIGGNENFGRMGVTILARDEVRVRMVGQRPSLALPVLTYDGDMTLHLNGEEASIFAVPPAHTDGDSFIHFRGSDVIFVGDFFRTVAFPIIDLNNGGTLQGTIEALAVAIGLSTPETLLVPGHGVVSTREDVIEFRDMILDVRDRVAEMVERGMTYDQVEAARPAAQYEAKWGDPGRFLSAVYSELGGEQ